MFEAISPELISYITIAVAVILFFIIYCFYWQWVRAREEKYRRFSREILEDKRHQLVTQERFEEAEALHSFIERLESGENPREVADEFFAAGWDIKTDRSFQEAPDGSIVIDRDYAVIKETER